MIDKSTGHLVISDNVEVKPNDSFDRIKELKLGESQDIIDYGNGYKWLTIRNLRVNGEYFILALCFHNDNLKNLNLVVSDTGFSSGSSWNDWEEVAEKNKVMKYREWIKEHLGREGTFAWGQINASYDSKGGASTILVEYN